MPRIAAVTCAVPPHAATQAEARRVAEKVFQDWPEGARYLSIFDHAGVERRHLAQPPAYHLQGHSFTVRNRDAVEASLDLGARAIRECLAKADYPPHRLKTFVLSTTTIVATPSIDALLAQRLPLPPDIVRIPLFGIGCAGGASALARAAERPPALLLSAEVCSLTFVPTDHTPTNVVAAALFGDGAAAALILPEGPGPEVVDSAVRLFPQSEDVMGWDVRDTGLSLVLSPRVPEMVSTHLRPMVESFLRKHRLAFGDVKHWVLHPGGPRVLEAYAEAFGLSREQLEPARNFLRDHGNLSSASVLFVLESIRALPGEIGLVVALGPGFAGELVLLRW